MANPEKLRRSIESFFKCKATHLETYHYGREETWEGTVEAFSLNPADPAPYCYAFVEPDGNFALVPQIPPVISPRTAIASRLSQRMRQSA